MSDTRLSDQLMGGPSKYVAELEAERDRLKRDLGDLRAIVAQTVAAIGNGSACSESASIDFMRSIPAEVRRTVDDLRARLAEKNELLDRALTAAEEIRRELAAAQARIVDLEATCENLRETVCTDADEMLAAEAREKMLREAAEAERDKLSGFYTEIVKQLGHDRVLNELTTAQARVAELEERLHYCNGTSELALKHRDEAEAREKTLREALDRLAGAYGRILRSHGNVPMEDPYYSEAVQALAGSAQPSAGVRNYQVLVFEPQIHRSVWQDYGSEEPMSEDEIVESMRAGVESGNYVGWRVLTLHKEVIGRDAVALARFKAAQPSAPEGGAWLQEADQRGYPEDADLENGRYGNVCRACGLPFIGHKRRVFCKPCNEGGGHSQK
jgi:hypothetical protein